MKIGVLKEIKREEYRVAMTPAGVRAMKENGHQAYVETGAGAGSGFDDAAYEKAGAQIVETPDKIYEIADLIMHVKEPLASEYELIREGQILFTFLHLAADRNLTRVLIKSRCIAVAYETVQKADGSLPLLAPMSEVAGRLAIQQGARYLEKPSGGPGMLLGGAPGVEPSQVVILGGGAVGAQAAKIAAGFGARVYVLDINLDRLRYLCDILPSNCFMLMADSENIERLLRQADLVVGAVLIPGAKAPRLISRRMLKIMKPGTVIVDVSVDQGGCCETSRPTTHNDPVFEIDKIIHYCVANMPGAVPKTSTIALTNATLPYALEIANKGWKKAFAENPEIRCGANIINGDIVWPGVGQAFGMKWMNVEKLL
ncbi:MAG: alanine dehydrogenase [Desulfobacterales bacterium]|jgi:alanine dehydrogenase|nr:alanine dehydrogenase [Desulfobacterales bacterium]MDD3082176.1 alanine dehydrogenase [Desulfobacterales bacterium]MDD3951333.1 alanine dehydrogenase [Desulfobacterales bacterium]MDD4462768.1 alanine dehydrogenase [Desulfobacterales bacterium]MDY0377592.1 alanine dehydrogenase [Desulfobacterales bacterium]